MRFQSWSGKAGPETMETFLVDELDAVTIRLHVCNLPFPVTVVPVLPGLAEAADQNIGADWLTQPDIFLAPRCRAIFARSSLT
jgi:hypothetical protein